MSLSIDFTADDARELVQSGEDDRIQQELDEIVELIRREASDGRRQVFVACIDSPKVERALKEAGYSISYDKEYDYRVEISF